MRRQSLLSEHLLWGLEERSVSRSRGISDWALVRRTPARHIGESPHAKICWELEEASLFFWVGSLYTARARAHPPPPPRLGRAPGSKAPGGPRRRKQSRGPHRSRRQPTPLPQAALWNSSCASRLSAAASHPGTSLFVCIGGLYTARRAHIRRLRPARL
jgi:hypothetical protein